MVAGSATGFAPPQRRVAFPQQSALQVSYDLDLGDEYKPKKGKNAAPAPAPEPEPAPEPVKAKRTPKKQEAAPVPPPPAPEPVKAKRSAPKKEPVAPPAPAPAPVVKAKNVKALPKIAVPKPPSKPTVVTTKDPNAAAGVALGGAPLLLAPIAALAAGRSVLSGTAARRAKIQAEIDEFERAKAKKAIQADVDGGALASAVVRNRQVQSTVVVVVVQDVVAYLQPSFIVSHPKCFLLFSCVDVFGSCRCSTCFDRRISIFLFRHPFLHAS